MATVRPKISVIVPVYKVEAYLEECVRSILTQTWEDFELLLVDDGSPDRCGEMCEELALRDERIKVFHKPNGGLSDARNYGIARARGEYLTFVDSDDALEKEYLSFLLNLCEKYSASMACVDMYSTEDRKPSEEGKRNAVDQCVSAEEALKICCLRAGFGVSAPSKLYRRDLFESIRFPVGKLYEDLMTIPWVIAQCDRVAYSKLPLYYYRQVEESITHRQVKERDLAAFSQLNKFVSWIDQNYPALHEAAICRYVDDTFITIVYRAVGQAEFTILMKKARHVVRPYWKQGIHNPYVPKGKKLQLRLLLQSPGLYQKVYGAVGEKARATYRKRKQ